MKCPNPKCESTNIIVKTTFKESHNRGLTKELQGLNINRRRYKCKNCGESLYTIEMLESDFETLKRPTGRLSQHINRIRGEN